MGLNALLSQSVFRSGVNMCEIADISTLRRLHARLCCGAKGVRVVSVRSRHVFAITAVGFEPIEGNIRTRRTELKTTVVVELAQGFLC